MDRDRIAELLQANSDLVEQRRAARAELEAAQALADAAAHALAEAERRRQAAEAARDQAQAQAARMLPLRLAAERARDEAIRHAAAQEAAAVEMLTAKDVEIARLRLALGLCPVAENDSHA